MTQHTIVTGIVLDDAALTLEELARACAVEPQWVVERIEAGFFGDGSLQVSHWRFSSRDLTRARRIRQLERDFDAAPELAALMADLVEEVEQLKGRLRAAGLSVD
ncbi:MAG: MerR family transcriptional regulator [Gammaproteobacteria bacterium BRH_c0]|nr:MAG: MerR family transcriptional regulator [Gammaproteobacteria bacterium BRH_c0]